MAYLGYSYDTLYGKYIWELVVFKDIAAQVFPGNANSCFFFMTIA